MMDKGIVLTHDSTVKVSLCVSLWKNYHSPTIIVGDEITPGDISFALNELGDN